MYIINLTQHQATPEQIRDGVAEPSAEIKERVKELLTFDKIPSHEEVKAKAKALAQIAADADADAAMIGGAPYLMRDLETEILLKGVEPLYSFSVRTSEERVNPDGTVTKVSVFKHVGFYAV